jgi:hypothetical protein
LLPRRIPKLMSNSRRPKADLLYGQMRLAEKSWPTIAAIWEAIRLGNSRRRPVGYQPEFIATIVREGILQADGSAYAGITQRLPLRCMTMRMCAGHVGVGSASRACDAPNGSFNLPPVRRLTLKQFAPFDARL